MSAPTIQPHPTFVSFLALPRIRIIVSRLRNLSRGGIDEHTTPLEPFAVPDLHVNGERRRRRRRRSCVPVFPGGGRRSLGLPRR